MVATARRWAAAAAVSLVATTAGFWLAPAALAQALTLGATSTADDSGLLDTLLSQFEATTKIETRVLVMGTGAILKLGETGDIDVLMVHDRAAEDRFMLAGFGESRRDVMASRFVVVGPAADPAQIRVASTVEEALRRIAASRAIFVSRGDGSGTHMAELRLWRDADVDPSAGGAGDWYRETGAGMGATLNTAVALDAYAITEIATWKSFGIRGNMETLVASDDPRLINPYGVIVVNQQRHDHIEIEAARAFARWLTGPLGQAAIAAFEINGHRPFVPTAAGGGS